MIVNMKRWARRILVDDAVHAIPVMTYPGLPLAGETLPALVTDGEAQYRCLRALAERYRTAAVLTVMDLSAEAEAFGSPVKFSDTEVPTVTGALVHDLEEARALAVPAVGAARTGASLRAATLAAESITDRVVFGGQIGPVSLASRLVGMTPLMLAMRRNPDFVHAVLEKATAFLVAYAGAFREAGANGLVIAEPVAGLLSPKQCDESSSRYVARIVDAVQDESFLVALHNCGNVVPLVPSMLSTGAAALHIGNAVAMTEVMPQVPQDRLVLGNVSPSAAFRIGTPESMADTVWQLLREMAPYRNFVLSSGCDVPPGTPLENVDAFFATLSEFNEEQRVAALIA